MAGTRRVVAWLKTISRSTVQFWKGELDVTTLRSVPSWGVSFLLHALLYAVAGRWRMSTMPAVRTRVP